MKTNNVFSFSGVKMFFVNRKWLFFICLYFVLIFCFSIVYFFVDGLSGVSSTDKLERYFTCLYFSVVTITTLGYGDIVPILASVKFFSSVEAVLGIVFIGFILNELWRIYADRQVKNIKNLEDERAIQNLLSYSTYLDVVVDWFVTSVFELINPIEGRGDRINIDEDFSFSQMQYVFNPSVLIVNVPKSALDVYCERTETLVDALRLCLSSYNISNYPDLYKNVIGFMRTTTVYDVCSILKVYAKNEDVKNLLVQFAKEHDRRPEPDAAHNMYPPFIGLYDRLYTQILFVKNIINALDDFKTNVSKSDD